MQEFLSTSHKIASKKPLWVQGAGGNISFKLSSTECLIKASGFRLQELNSQCGWLKINREIFLQKFSELGFTEPQAHSTSEEQYNKLIQDLSQDSKERASMEAGFHLLLPHKWVLHFHSLAAILMAHHYQQNNAKLKDWLNKLPFCIHFIEYLQPGLQLSCYFDQKPWDLEKDYIFLLQNHGVILASKEDTCLLDKFLSFEKDFLETFHYKNLLNLYQLEKPLWALEKNTKDFYPNKIHFFIPDSIVFADRIKWFLDYNKELLKNDQINMETLEPKELDALELWLAENLLYNAEPNLQPIPVELHKNLVNLPSEQHRRNK